MAANRFIFRRGALRGLAHWLIMWGCLLAAAITFPLVWGWIHFETVPGDLEIYRTFVFGVPVQDFPVESLLAFLIFHGLVWSSFLVIAGVMLAFRRRMIDHGAAAAQQFGAGHPAAAAAVRDQRDRADADRELHVDEGLRLRFLAILHAVTVIVTLLWLPFGKLFHIFQRPAQLGVSFYKDAGARGEQARCRRCGVGVRAGDDGRAISSTVERELGFRYELADGGHYQEVCPQVPARALRPARRERCGNDPRRRTGTIIDRFGPHLSAMTGVRLSTSVEPERLVKTHCCFCGQQCGIQLKVRDNEVIGFEPWEDFPFNRGMLCPKGVKRYLQGSHPDRLLTAAAARPVGAGGFSADAVRRRDRARRPPRSRGCKPRTAPASIGVLGGASLTTEKTYLLGKFARVCLKTPYIDYNGRLCMVSAGAANKKAFGIDRTTNPWSDMIGADVIWVAGSNVAECSPITTNYIWQAREQGAKIIVQDPRITPVARTCDLYLPVKPGRDAALFAGVLQIMIERDWIDRRVHRRAHRRLRAGGRVLPRVDARAHRRGHRRAAPRADAGRRNGGARAQIELPVPRARHRAPLQRRAERARHDQPRARVRPHRPAAIAATAPSSGRPTARAGASTARSAISCPGWRDITNPEHRRYIAGVWGIDEARAARARASTPTRCSARSTPARSRGCSSICFNPKVSLPDNTFVTRCLEKLEFFVAIDFFLNDTARHADIVLPGSLHEEDEGTVTQVEGRIIKINKAVDCPGRGAAGLAHHPGHRRARSAGRTASRSPSRARSSKSCASPARAASPTTRASPTRRSSARWACSGPATAEDPRTGEPLADHPGTPRLFEPGSYNPVAKGAGPFYFPDGRARFNVADYRAAGRRCERGVSRSS